MNARPNPHGPATISYGHPQAGHLLVCENCATVIGDRHFSSPVVGKDHPRCDGDGLRSYFAALTFTADEVRRNASANRWNIALWEQQPA